MSEYIGRTATPDLRIDALVRVLEFATDSLCLEPTPGRAHAAVRESLSADPSLSNREALVRAGEAAGLSIRVVSRSIFEVVRSAHPQAIWIAIPSGAHRTCEAIAVVERRKRKVHAVVFSATTETVDWSISRLVEVLGAHSENEPVEWFVTEAAQPMALHEGDHHSHEYHGIPPFQRLMLLLRTERQDLWVAIVYSAAIGLLTLVVPITTQSLVNTVAFGTVMQPLVVLTVVVLIALGFSTVLHCLRAWVVELIQQRIFVRVATDVVYRLLRVQAQAFDRHHGPELVNRFLEVVTVQKSGGLLLIDGLAILMQTLIGMALLAVYHPWLLVYDLFLFAGIVFVLFGMARGAVSTSIRESRAKYSLVAWLEEIARHLITFKSSHGAALALSRTDQLTGQYIMERRSHFRILLRQIAGSLVLQAIASATLLGIGGWLVINRQLTLGQLIAAEIVVAAVVSGFSKFGKQLETFYDLQAAMDKLGYLTDLPLENSGMEPLPRTPSGMNIRLSDVSYSYGTKTVLKGMNWSIKAGARVGISGHGGVGKSTLLDIFYGIRPPSTGTFEIDGRDYRELRLADFRSQVVLVRDNEIFEGTVAENVRLGNMQVTSEAVRAALRAAGVLDAVMALPHGIHTRLATGGLPLSPSKAMRVMMARAIVSKPRLLLVDQALEDIDDLDMQGELVRTLFASDAQWTVVMTTENRALLERCDEWYTVHNGSLQSGALTS